MAWGSVGRYRLHVNGRRQTVDDTAAPAVPGVTAVLTLTAGQGGVAVIARTTDTALRGRAALSGTWTGGTPAADSRVWLDELEAALPAVPGAPDVQRVFEVIVVPSEAPIGGLGELAYPPAAAAIASALAAAAPVTGMPYGVPVG
jgi:isoquinoline 1-oxidoreductase beta subunit